MTAHTDRDAPGRERTFREPWQAQAFALTLELHAAGHFTWQEWSRYLGTAIRSDGTPGESGDDDYYRHWLSALERLLADKGLVSDAEHRRRQHEWDRAARNTPHGRPITLAAGQRRE